MSEARHKSLKSMIENERAIYDYPPDPFSQVLVHCEDFSCMGYVDQKGIWRHRYNDQPVVGRVVAWESF